MTNTGARNQAFLAAESQYGVPRELLMAIAFDQGRFESPSAQMEKPHVMQDEGLSDPNAMGDAEVVPHRFGIMFLSPEQVVDGAKLIGTSEDEVRYDLEANVFAAAALLKQGAKEGSINWNTLEPYAEVVVHMRELDDVPAAARLAVDGLKTLLNAGFDRTTDDNERVAVKGFGTPSGTSTQNLGGGLYPPLEWIGSPNHSSRNGAPVQFIIVHDIEGTMAGAVAQFSKTSVSASSHFVTRASDGRVVQMVSEDRTAWHCGNGYYNSRSIGIEHEGYAHKPQGGGYYTATQYRASAQLVAALVTKYKIPVDRAHIFGHLNVPRSGSGLVCSDAKGLAGSCGGTSGHTDPGPYWDWNYYLNLIADILIPPTPPVVPTCGVLPPGGALARGQSVTSCNGTTALHHQTDGNVVLYQKNTGKALWESGTSGASTILAMQSDDGNLVLYNGSQALWATSTNSRVGAFLKIQDDGNLVVYGGGNRAIWASNTQLGTGAPGQPQVPATCGSIKPGEGLIPGQSHASCNGKYSLTLNQNGDVVWFQTSDNKVLWQSSTKGSGATQLLMQPDGNLVAFSQGDWVWSSWTQHHQNPFLALQDDGNLVVYGDGTDQWASRVAP